MVSAKTHLRKATRCCTAAVAIVGVVAGCSAPGTAESSNEALLATVDTPLHDPVWSYRNETLLALTDDGRLAEIAGPDSTDGSRTQVSAPLAAGRNLQVSQKDARLAFIGQPKRGTVAVVDLDSLNTVDRFDAGPAPAYLAEDAGQRVLLALAADGRSVTPVDEYDYSKLPTMAVTGEPADTIDGANRGHAIEYHTYGRSGIRYYKGASPPAEQRASLAIDVAAAAGDGAKTTRSYVAERGQNVLYAIDSSRDGKNLSVVGQARLPSSPIRYLGSDDTRIYAATDHDLVVLETNSFTGYPDATVPIICTVDYRTDLPRGAVESAPLSGMAIGPDRVYLSLAGQPKLISVAKPHL